MMVRIVVRRLPLIALAAFLTVLGLAGAATAHSELVTASPAEGTVVPSPFRGPIVLTFSEHLATGSKADLIGPDGSTIAAAKVDAAAKTMSFALTAALDPGAYQVRWVTIADDGDVLRQPIVTFTVAAAPSPSPSPSSTAAPAATATATAAPAATASATTASPATSPGPSPTAAPSSAGTTTGGAGDVVLPIIVALLILGVGAGYLLIRRNRPTDPT